VADRHETDPKAVEPAGKYVSNISNTSLWRRQELQTGAARILLKKRKKKKDNENKNNDDHGSK